MSELWLQIVGLGADGLAGLRPSARAAVESAEVIFGAERHHRLTAELDVERVAWPSPFDHLLNRLEAHRGRRVVVLVSGDPMWRSAGSRIAAAFPEAVAHPHVSAYQLAAARMLWPLNGCETLTLHGRGPERSAAALRPFVQPGARLLALAADGDSAQEVGAALAGECRAEAGAPLAPAVPGLADELFEHDGVMTKREVRAATLARLAPLPGQMLWDVGCGCGSVAIEWMRAARGAKAVGLEPRADRRAMASANAQVLGAPGLALKDGRAPEGLAGLPAPDAVFLGGGLSEAAAEAAWWALSPGGRLVANAVTLESEALLVRLAARFGGELSRIRIERASPVGEGGPLAWRPAMSVTQWGARK